MLEEAFNLSRKNVKRVRTSLSQLGIACWQHTCLTERQGGNDVEEGQKCPQSSLEEVFFLLEVD